jgi:hypothetical protein
MRSTTVPLEETKAEFKREDVLRSSAYNLTPTLAVVILRQMPIIASVLEHAN